MTISALPKRYKKTGVGKFIGGRVYFHKNYVSRFIHDPIFMTSYKPLLEYAQRNEFDYTIIAYDVKEGNMSFTFSPDWDTAPEPLVGSRISYDPDIQELHDRVFNPGLIENPFIYHHKWLFVDEDYKGFDIEESMLRSASWMCLEPDYSRIGRKKYWEEEVLPRIGEND